MRSVCRQPISGDCYRCLQMQHSTSADDSDTPEQRVAKLHSASGVLHAAGDHEMVKVVREIDDRVTPGDVNHLVARRVEHAAALGPVAVARGQHVEHVHLSKF